MPGTTECERVEIRVPATDRRNQLVINRSVLVSAVAVVALLVIGCGAPAGFDRTAAFPDHLADKIEHIVQSRLDVPG